ncbi:MAG: hypothetical protein V4858_27135 [Pseudomonadota bacterium]
MTHRRTAQNAGLQSLVWLLLVAVALMGLTITRQQALGSLHIHADRESQGTPRLSTAVATLANDWLSRWQQQHVFGHGQLLLGTASGAAPWPSNISGVSHTTDVRSTHAHDHDSLERHHHTVDDGSVIALDGAAEVADDSAAGALILLPVAATPNDGPAMPAIAERRGPWPVDNFAAFVSRNVAPLLRPPSR